jgi:hypothetical protein
MTKKEILRILDKFGRKGSKSDLLLSLKETSEYSPNFDELCLLGLIKLGSNEKEITWATTDFGNNQIEFYRPLTKNETKLGLRFYSMVYGKE